MARPQDQSRLEVSSAQLQYMGLAPIHECPVDGGHSTNLTFHELMLMSCLLIEGGISIL